MAEAEEADTPQRRILYLRGWVKSNYRTLLDGALDAHPYADVDKCMSDVQDRVKREAMDRYVLLPAAAKGYAESAVAPFFGRFESDLKGAAEAHAKKTRSEFGILTGRASNDTASRKAAVECFNILSKDGGPVERALWVQAIVKTSKFDEQVAVGGILRLVREGLVYESKPGFYKRLQG
jgi:hypothetical protein